jgi:Protein of unknown function (DUF3489)
LITRSLRAATTRRRSASPPTGLEAIGVEPEDRGSDLVPAEADTAPPPAEAGVQAEEGPAHGTDADTAATPAKSKAKAKATKRGKAASAGKPTLRAGTKQALLIELLKRPEGATLEQVAEATGWQKHTIRGAISGALKKKLGLTVEVTREVGPNKGGAKSATVYRITGSSRTA